ncbi:uncharacterized protein LOC135494822 [Lineus longissimus]|uniref:uncharacterized protein LOC135494822 n=1 Tax=Lineus longissimus TaxID=88925 RepID=UPI002B4E0BFC
MAHAEMIVSLAFVMCLLLNGIHGAVVDEDCEIVRIKDVSHDSPASAVYQPSSVEDCAEICKEDNRCLAATFEKARFKCALHYMITPLKGNTEVKNHEYDFLVKKCPEKVKNEGCRMLTLTGRQRPNTIFSRYRLDRSDDCKLLCKVDPGCVAASYEKPYTLCWIHYELGYVLHDRSDQFYDYYAKACEATIEICSITATEDARQVTEVYKEVDVQTAYECGEDCERDDKCHAATFVKPKVELKENIFVLPPKRPAFCLEYEQVGEVKAGDLAKGNFVHIKKSCEVIQVRQPEIDLCASNPCLQGSKCRAINGTHRCICEMGYEYLEDKGCTYTCHDNFGKTYYDGDEVTFKCSTHRCSKAEGLQVELACETSDGRCLPDGSSDFTCILNGAKEEHCMCYIDSSSSSVMYFPLLETE